MLWAAAPAEDADSVWVEKRSAEVEEEIQAEREPRERAKKQKAWDKLLEEPMLKNDLPEAGLADMAALSHLHEPAMLRNLQLRCEAGRVYTWCGDVCVSINPYTRDSVWEGQAAADADALPSPLYDRCVMERYSGQALGDLSPHVFAVADKAYRSLKLRQTSQAKIWKIIRHSQFLVAT